MSDSIELFEPEGFIPNDLRPPNVTFKPRRARRINKKAVAIYQSSNKRVATESIENVSAKKSMRLGNDPKPSHRLSMRLDDGQGPSGVLSRLNDGLPKDKKPFPSLKERLEIQRERELNIDNDDPHFITFPKYGIRKDCNEWSLLRSIGEVRLFNKKLNCSIVIPANRSSTLMVNLPKDLNQWRLKDRIPDERKYVIYNHDLNSFIKAPFGVINAFPDDPNPIFNSPLSSCLPSTSSSQIDLKCTTPNSNRSESIETTSIGIQTDPENFNFNSDTQLTKSLWETEFAIAEFEQQNRNLLRELSNLKVSLNCANRSRANAKINADRAESKLEISERVTSVLFEENKEVKQLEEVTSKAESLQSELLESNDTNILLKKKLDEYDLANKRFQEPLIKKAAQIKEQTEIEKLLKQLQVMRVEIDIQRAEAIQLIQAVDGQQY